MIGAVGKGAQSMEGVGGLVLHVATPLACQAAALANLCQHDQDPEVPTY